MRGITQQIDDEHHSEGERMPTMPETVEAAEVLTPPIKFDWANSPNGSMLAVLGSPAVWEKLHFSDGEKVSTASVGIMTRHEALVTRAIHDRTWQLIEYGPLVIAIQIES